MKQLFLSLALVSVAATSFANVNRPIRHDDGIYINAYGASAYNYDSSASSSKFNHYGNGVMVGLGYQFNSHLALEGEFGYFSVNDHSGLNRVYQPAIALKAIAPMLGNINLFAKVGVAENIYNFDGSQSNQHKFRPLVGLGAGISLTQAIEVDALVQSTIDHETVNQHKSWTGNSFVGAGVTVYF